jgi:magnesium transporter
VREELGLHALAVEDVFDQGQRPKVDHYPTHLFAVMYSVEFDPGTKRIRGHEVGIFLTKNALVTVHADEGFDIEQVIKRWDDTAHLAANGVAYLLHGVLDYVVDTHFDTIQQLDTEIDGLEDRLFDERTTDAAMQRATFELRKSLVEFRRIALPMREVVNTLMRRDLEMIDSDMAPYFQDVYDHVLRVTEWTESLRDLIANILETRLTLRGNRLNVIMKQVTSWAAIIAVPTAVTGFYGQNVPFPGFERPIGFWTSSVIIVGLSTALYLIFKRKEWL